MSAVSQVQDPEDRHLVGGYNALSADAAVQAAPAELRLAFGVPAAEHSVTLDHVYDLLQHGERVRKAFGSDERKVICRTVVFGILAVWCPRETTDWKIESRRAVLPLVIAVRCEWTNLIRRPVMAEPLRDDPVYLGVSSATLLVRYVPGVAEA